MILMEDEERRIDWEPVTPTAPVPTVASAPVAVQPVRAPVRPFSTKKRDLTAEERKVIRNLYTDKNGQVMPEDCIALKERMASDLGMTQVVGLLAYLHQEAITRGTRNQAYLAWRRVEDAKPCPVTTFKGLLSHVMRPARTAFARKGYAK